MFYCERCGYSSIYKGNIKNHLNRRIICKALVKDIGIVELKEIINKKNKLIKNDSKMTPIEPKMNPIEPKMNPIEPKLNPNEPKLNPIEPKLNPIEPKLKNHICKICNKAYSTNSHMNRHMKNCKKQIIVSNNKNEDNLLKYITLIEQEKSVIEQEKSVIEKEKSVIEKENKLIKKEKQVLRKEIEKLIDKVGGDTTINQQNNIYINNYGNENVEYLTKAYLDNLLKIPYSSVLNLIKDTYFNPDHPENHNVKIPSRKEKYAIVYTEGEWLFRRKRDFISNIVDKSYNMIDCHFEDNMMSLTDIKKHNFIEFRTDYCENDNVKKDIEEEVEVHILNS